MNTKLSLSDIIITITISLVFAVIYKLWWGVYELLKPLGLHIEQLGYGMWYIAAIVAFLIIKKPYVALLAEFAAGAGETIFMGQFDIPTLFFALFQGLACEAVFFATRYKSTSLLTCSFAALAAGIISLPIDWYYGYIEYLQSWNIIMFVLFRLIGAVVLAGFLAYYLVKQLELTGVTRLIQRSSEEDYKNL